jgi:hypothetical protein
MDCRPSLDSAGILLCSSAEIWISSNLPSTRRLKFPELTDRLPLGPLPNSTEHYGCDSGGSVDRESVDKPGHPPVEIEPRASSSHNAALRDPDPEAGPCMRAPM